jgi:hypothetical protein
MAMKCDIVSYIHDRRECLWCNTHFMPVPGFEGRDKPCAYARIKQAEDEAIKRIQDAADRAIKPTWLDTGPFGFGDR